MDPITLIQIVLMKILQETYLVQYILLQRAMHCMFSCIAFAIWRYSSRFGFQNICTRLNYPPKSFLFLLKIKRVFSCITKTKLEKLCYGSYMFKTIDQLPLNQIVFNLILVFCLDWTEKKPCANTIDRLKIYGTIHVTSSCNALSVFLHVRT